MKILAILLLLMPSVMAADYRSQVRGNNPLAYWTFEEEPGDLGPVGAVSLDEPGPDPEMATGMLEPNRALKLKGDGGHLEPPVDEKRFRFDKDDPITIEAWVNPDHISKDRNVYIVGKGRTYEGGAMREDQNFALRLRGVGDSAHLSFLFRSRATREKKEEYHRWTSSQGFNPGTGWHHVAVSFVFGKQDSLKGYIDGYRVDGAWDMGGKTNRPPVVSDGKVWIGSARAGAPGNSFNGALDEIAIFRSVLTELEIARRCAFEEVVPKPSRAIPHGEVMVEIHKGLSSFGTWPRRAPQMVETWSEQAFALFDIPPKYNDWGVRVDRPQPFLMRAWAEVHVPGGRHTLLLRGHGGTRLMIDGEEVAATPFARKQARNAHGLVLEWKSDYDGLRAPRIGDNEKFVEVELKEGRRRILLETIVGGVGTRAVVGESLVAISSDGKNFKVLAPSNSGFPLDDAAWEEFESAAREHHKVLNMKRRAKVSAERNRRWAAKHEKAREYVDSLKPLSTVPGLESGNPVDAYISARIAKTRAGLEKAAHSEFAEKVKPLLEENCFRCHGEKEKGELRLDVRERALAGGGSELPAVVPRMPEKSLLLDVIQSTGDDRMPPKGDGLDEEQVALLEEWIRDGAEYGETVDESLLEVKPVTDDLAFLRRVFLDTVGVPPGTEESRTFLESRAADKRAKAIERLLADDRWADHWTSYWQDVLAENPNLLKPTLNNTGPFRWWIHEAMLDNKPMDRFVTELITFQGSTYSGGAAGFKVAAENDVPMAAKAHIISSAFLGVDMKCARCHDAPFHSSTQEDLFQFAAALGEKPLKVPASSSVPAAFFEKRERKPLITVSLEPGEQVSPDWPFPELMAAPGRRKAHDRVQVAAMITDPGNLRFAKVMVNRVWARLMGEGIVEPVHDWEGNAPSHPELLEWLARDFVRHGYDLKHTARTILTSETYQRMSVDRPLPPPGERFFAAPARRRMSAEQIVDSLFASTGNRMATEEITFDPEGYYPANRFLNMGKPRRAWEFATLANERDRPSLALPRGQIVVDALKAFGWKGTRQDPVHSREVAPNVLQPGIIAKSVLATWLVSLSDDAEMTESLLRDVSLDRLIDDLFLRFQTRIPTDIERAALRDLLADGYESRVIEGSSPNEPTIFPRRRVSWINSLSNRANEVQVESQMALRKGPEPTNRLDPGWRRRAEDVVWALVNSPEFLFVP